MNSRLLSLQLPFPMNVMPLSPTDDLRIKEISPLISPAILSYYYPIEEAVAHLVTQTRGEAARILRGEDDRLLIVLGPCSIHDPEAAIEYAERLLPLREKYERDLLLVMRVYFEKPRTTVGWKGLINDPRLDDSFDINRGLSVARELLLNINRLGVPAGTEFLDAISPQYYADLISWGAIGARTVESQVHRELASGLSMPVGFKNGTGGTIQIAVDAIGTASHPHHFLSVTKQGVSAIVSTGGNKDCHLILRGGASGTNYDEQSISRSVELLKKAGLPPYVMVDCSHGNSNKDYRNQPKVAQDLCEQISHGSSSISSVMIESNLIEGNQKLTADTSSLTYGQSITDACISWESTLEVVEEFAQAVQRRRK